MILDLFGQKIHDPSDDNTWRVTTRKDLPTGTAPPKDPPPIAKVAQKKGEPTVAETEAQPQNQVGTVVGKHAVRSRQRRLRRANEINQSALAGN